MIALLSVLQALLMVPPWLVCPAAGRRRWEQSFFRRLAKGFGLSILPHGTISSGPGTLFIMNHISWADVVVMLATVDADFVARGDIAQWPIIGWLARRFNPVFVARDRRHMSAEQANAIRGRLRSGRNVILCAEGTTSEGASILPFRTSLISAADASEVIQPVVLRYLTPGGERLPPSRQRAVAWIDDDDLVSGAMRLATSHTLARIDFLSPTPASAMTAAARKSIAQHIRSDMLDVYAALAKRPR